MTPCVPYVSRAPACLQMSSTCKHFGVSSGEISELS